MCKQGKVRKFVSEPNGVKFTQCISALSSDNRTDNINQLSIINPMSDLALQRIREAKEKRLIHLDLGMCGITELPNELFELTWLENLILDNKISENHGSKNNIEHLSSQFSKLTHLKKLEASGEYANINKISDLSPLAALVNLQEINISYTQVHDLGALKALVNLQEINVSYTQVRDLGALATLINLREINISNTQVSDLSPLEGLSNLRNLYISRTKVSDLNPLKALMTLHIIGGSYTQGKRIKIPAFFRDTDLT